MQQGASRGPLGSRGFQGPAERFQALTHRFAAAGARNLRGYWKVAENAGAMADSFYGGVKDIPIKGEDQCTLYIFGSLGWLTRCTGGAPPGSIRPFSIGSSRCLTQYGRDG